MPALSPKITGILQKYMRDPATLLTPATVLSALDIDALDLPMIFLDIEDVYDVQISYADEIDAQLTVGRLLACIAEGLDAKCCAGAQPIVRRRKGNWMSTGAGR